MHKLISHIPALITILGLITVSCSNSQKPKPDLEKGFMDLSSWNWEEDGIVDLNGEWAQNGYATYRLQVKVPDINTDYNFIFSSMSSSAKLWINGSLCMQRGLVGSNKDQSKPQWIHKYYTPIQY